MYLNASTFLYLLKKEICLKYPVTIRMDNSVSLMDPDDPLSDPCSPLMNSSDCLKRPDGLPRGLGTPPFVGSIDHLIAGSSIVAV